MAKYALRGVVVLTVTVSLLASTAWSADAPYQSGAVKGGEEPRQIKLNISGWKDLYLVVGDAGDYHNDVAEWCDARLVTKDGKEVYLDTLAPTWNKQEFGQLRRDGKNVVGGELVIGTKTFKRGLGTHAKSVVHYALKESYETFEASVGVDMVKKDVGVVEFTVTNVPPTDFFKASAKKGKAETVAAAKPAAKNPVQPVASPTSIEVGVANAANCAALRRAVNDLMQTCPEKYTGGKDLLIRLEAIEKRLATPDTKLNEEFVALQRDALLANPALDFEQMLVVKRNPKMMGLPQNWQSNSNLARTGFDNEIDVLSSLKPDAKLTRVYQHPNGSYVGDLKLHFNADRLMFSAIGSNKRWHIFEMKTDGTDVRQVTHPEPNDIDNYDACYLPNGAILYTSTASFTGVPCVNGGSHVSTLFRMEADGKTIRQLCFEQEHDWYPSILNNGRVLYSRWEYTDTPHSNTRLLFHMNPDGSNQTEYYKSNSYWPNSLFYAKPLPGHPTKVVTVISGHHGVPRMGELLIFDPALARSENQGVVQRIPGYGQPVEPIIRDQLVNSSWPRFLHPYPLNEKYFLVACQPSSKSQWGIYLVDVFDNMLLIREEPGYALLEPNPIRKTPTPPVVPDKVDPTRTDALVYIQDIYAGEGMKGVPRGTVKNLRILTYHFAYHNMGGLLGVLGLDGPWDIKRIMGTVPVQEDGSAYFRIPANTPISMQPLDSEGKALQIMRSWTTAMPGETMSCVGCHEKQNTAPLGVKTLALASPAAEIVPWRGPTRGFSYPREVQPVLDKYCISCHDGKTQTNGVVAADLRGDTLIKDFAMRHAGNGGKNGGLFSVGYAEMHRYVRRPGIESDYHTLTPMEFHADTTELVQLLKKGHYGVQLDAEAWDRLITWIDLNTVYHGTWTDARHDPGVQRERRRSLLKQFGNRDDDPEAEAGGPAANLGPAVAPKPVVREAVKIENPANWPFSAEEAQKLQAAAGKETKKTIELGEGVTMELVLIPAGEYIMGDANASTDEYPPCRVKIEKPFWMGKSEVTNEQFARFDSLHDSRVESKLGYQFGIHGYPANKPNQPVVRVSWKDAAAFCNWLGSRSGLKVNLPTEAQWEWACRAGSNKAFWFGDILADYSKFANVGDAKLVELASNPYTPDTPYPNPTKYDDWVPKDTRFNDGWLISAPVGSYQANPWGLYDMHGNVGEWTRSDYKAYPYRDDDGRNNGADDTLKVVRGGSWRERPFKCTASFRQAYRTYQPVFNVGFRVVCEAN